MKRYTLAMSVINGMVFLIFIDIRKLDKGETSELSIVNLNIDNTIHIFDILCTTGIEVSSQTIPVTTATLCCICLEDIQNNTMVPNLPCRHIFHINCLSTWVRYGDNCPVCRVSII